MPFERVFVAPRVGTRGRCVGPLDGPSSPAMNCTRSLASLALLFTLAACGRGDVGGSDLWERSAIHKAKKAGKLVVLMEAQFKPFTYKEAGELKGFDVELGRELAKEMKVEAEFRERDFNLLANELLQGKGDLVISGITATPERSLEASFSEPYYLTRTIALLGVPKADGVKAIADLDAPGRRIVVQGGSTGQYAVEKHMPKAQLAKFDDETACVLEVVQGRADAFIYDEWQVREHARVNPGATRVLAETLSVEPYAIECRKGDPDTVEWLNLVIESMKRDGRLAALYAKHLPGIEIHTGLGFVKK
jgi:polar amino acid transport system substrate-binding protein